jgi:acyl-CoA synthetase (NDP forming)
LTLTIGAGGVLVELLSDVANLLFPVSRDDVGAALKMLRIWPLLKGYRGRAAGDVDGLVDAVMAVVAYAQSVEPALLELDVNPVLVLPQGRGVLAVDAFIRLAIKE